jgi:hypothetical protein
MKEDRKGDMFDASCHEDDLERCLDWKLWGAATAKAERTRGGGSSKSGPRLHNHSLTRNSSGDTLTLRLLR